MPRKPKTPPAALPTIPAELLERFGNGPSRDGPSPATTKVTGLTSVSRPASPREE